MGRYTLEIVEPRAEASSQDEKEELDSALDALATVHGGMVVGSAQKSGVSVQRQYVNIFDCESSLEGEVDWLRKRFPEIRFTLKQFTA